MLRSTFTFATLLALSFLFNEAHGFWFGKMVIGYATVSKEEAEKINEHNKLYEHDKLHVTESASPTQLGPGVYMVNKPDIWKGEGGSWYCAIKASKWQMKKIRKAYIPRSLLKLESGVSRRIFLWNQDETVIVNYMSSELWMRKPQKALRFSWVRRGYWEMQMLIPTDVVKKDKLDLWAKCFESEDELVRFSGDIINWAGTWGIKGDRGRPTLGAFRR
ncbi:uncharacterized protein L3040_008697 [Drepanopeziza brunnea f. sp. 'multigermtubi']|nr:hypothetical protein L3040_008697 [Drepanopeziza brunnea f. sp. 'multigermtubi']